MKSLVVDTSSMLKLLDADRDGEKVRRLYDQILQGRITVYTPTFFLVETLNILLKKKKFSQAEANEFIELLTKSNIHFVDFPSSRIRDLAEVATRYRITAYDAHYVLLAQDLKSTLMTEDKELLAVRKLSISVHEYSIGA